VWAGEHQGLKVAVKVLRVYSTSDFNRITSVSRHLKLVKSTFRRVHDRCDRTDVLQGSRNMEDPLSSECAPAVGSDNGGEALCDGFRMDGQWEHQRVRQGT